MPLDFKKLGISFQYPENWALDEQDALEGRRSVTVYSPGGGFWSVSIHPRSTDPAELAKAAAEALAAEYENVETEKVDESFAGRELVGFDLNFFYLDLINTATVRCLRTDRATYAIFCQAEDREFTRIQPVFQAMTISLLSHFKTGRTRND